jgi:hypothetical protein
VASAAPRGSGTREGGAAAAHPRDLWRHQAVRLQVALQLDPLLSVLTVVTRLPPLLLLGQLKFVLDMRFKRGLGHGLSFALLKCLCDHQNYRSNHSTDGMKLFD